MTIRIIDLLNKATSGEKIPKKIKYYGTEFKLEPDGNYYINDRNEDLLNFIGFVFFEDLNNIIEILPEEKDDTYCMTD